MINYAYYLISDIHLEKKNEYKKTFLLDSINKVIEKNKIAGKQTIIVFSGDVNNGTKAYEWFKKIDTQIIYTPGNHEFWKNDYYETLDNLHKDVPNNVHFLHNNFVECGDYLFLGSTMWTDVGKSLNDDLKYVTNGIMNDNYEITAKKWYINQNIKNLKKILPDYGFNENLEKKCWNILVEQEENAKTIYFFTEFAIIRNQLIKFKEQLIYVEKDFNNKYFSMTEKQVQALNQASKFENYSYKQWLLICKDNNLLGYGEVLDSMIEAVSVESEIIFKKLSKMNYDKKLVVVSHHLPFLEERLVGHYSHNENAKKLYNDKADSAIYTIRNGLVDYPHHNYFYRISKGEFSRDESISQAVHYSNNGAVNLPEYLLKDVSAWCHGHDHTINYQDFVRGVPILTNPMSYSLDVFIFSEKGIHLNESYKKYHKIDSEEKEIKEVNKLRESVLRPISFNEFKNTEEMIKLWIFSLMDYDKIYNLMDKFNQNNKKAFTYLAKNPQFSIGEISDKQYQKIQEFIFANYYYYNELDKELDKLDIAYAVRKDNNFSYMNKINKVYDKDISAFFLSQSKYNIQINNFSKESLEDYFYDSMTSELFKNIYYMNKAIKTMKHLGLVLKEMGDIKSITELFNKVLPNIYLEEAKESFFLDRELEEKKEKIMGKYITEDILKEKEDRYKKNFDF